VDLRLGPDIHAAGGLIHDQHRTFAGEPFGQGDLLLVAAAQRGDASFQRGGLDAEPPGEAAHQRLFGGRVDHAEAGEALQRGEGRVLAAVHREHETQALAVFGEQAKPGGEGGLNLAQGELPPAHPEASGGPWIQAEDRLRDLAPARADQTGKAQHFTGTHGEADVLEAAG